MDSVLTGLAGVLAFGLLVYLVWALLCAEDF